MIDAYSKLYLTVNTTLMLFNLVYCLGIDCIFLQTVQYSLINGFYVHRNWEIMSRWTELK